LRVRSSNRGARRPAVVGFDGSKEGTYSTATLTTVVTDKAAIAERAVECLGNRIVGDARIDARKITIGFTLDVRESTIGNSDRRLVSPARETSGGRSSS
jgi:DNA-binding LacI/PurR family transcriptional regulator